MTYRLVDLANDHWRRQPRDGKGRWTDTPGASGLSSAAKKIHALHAAGKITDKERDFRLGEAKRAEAKSKISEPSPQFPKRTEQRVTAKSPGVSKAEVARLTQRFADIERQVADYAKTHPEAGEDYWSGVARGEVRVPRERKALHDRLLRKALADAIGGGAKKEKKVLVLGGLPGAGKSTILKQGEKAHGLREKDYVVVNPDNFKELLAEHDAIPKIGNLAPMERSGAVHEEASYLAGRLQEIAATEGYNVALDITMANPRSTRKKIDALTQGYGYKPPVAVFVDVPVSLSKERALLRYQHGMERYRKGEGDGGRPVPLAYMDSLVSKTVNSKNRESFDILQEQGVFTGGSKVYDQFQNQTEENSPRRRSL